MLRHQWLAGLLCLLGFVHTTPPVDTSSLPIIELDDDEGYPTEAVYQRHTTNTTS